MSPSTRAPGRTGRTVRTVTITWGAVILVIAGLLLVSQFVTLAMDPVVVALGLLVGVGVALVTGGLLSLRDRADEHSDHATSFGAGGLGAEDPRDYSGSYGGDYSGALSSKSYGSNFGSGPGDEPGGGAAGVDNGPGHIRY